VREPNSSIASPMYFDQLSALRTCAPRIGTRLCIVWVQFSAMQSQPSRVGIGFAQGSKMRGSPIPPSGGWNVLR